MKYIKRNMRIYLENKRLWHINIPVLTWGDNLASGCWLGPEREGMRCTSKQYFAPPFHSFFQYFLPQIAAFSLFFQYVLPQIAAFLLFFNMFCLKLPPFLLFFNIFCLKLPPFYFFSISFVSIFYIFYLLFKNILNFLGAGRCGWVENIKDPLMIQVWRNERAEMKMLFIIHMCEKIPRNRNGTAQKIISILKLKF